MEGAVGSNIGGTGGMGGAWGISRAQEAYRIRYSYTSSTRKEDSPGNGFPWETYTKIQAIGTRCGRGVMCALCVEALKVGSDVAERVTRAG